MEGYITYILPSDHRCRRGWVAGQEFFLRCKSLLASVVLIKDISYIHLFGTTKNWHTPRMFFCVGTRFHCPMEYRYTVRRKSSPGLEVSILGPVGPVGSLGPGRRKIQISQATQAKARNPGKNCFLPG